MARANAGGGGRQMVAGPRHRDRGQRPRRARSTDPDREVASEPDYLVTAKGLASEAVGATGGDGQLSILKAAAADISHVFLWIWDRRASRESKLIGQSQSQAADGQAGVRRTGRGENGPVTDIDGARAMYAQVGIDH